MRPKRLVIDANILIRAVLGSRVRGLIEHYCNSVAFYIAEANAEPAMGGYRPRTVIAGCQIDTADQ